MLAPLPPPFNKTCPCTIFPLSFLSFAKSPLREFKKGEDPNYD